MKKVKGVALTLVTFLAQPEFRPAERRLLRVLYLAALGWVGYKGAGEV